MNTSFFGYQTFLASLLTVALACSGVASAEAPRDPSDEHPEVTLAWKFAEGDQVDYVHKAETKITETLGGESRTTIDRLLYRYKWTVVFPIAPDGHGIGVEFGRVWHAHFAPEGVTTVDTYAPLATSDMTPLARDLQNEAYYIKQQRYVFVAYPNGGVMWPEHLLGDMAQSTAFQTPRAIPFFDASTFTAGDSLSVPAQPVKIGDTWSSLSSDGNTEGRYRLVGRANQSGVDCWKVTGITTYELGSAPDHIAEIQLGPRRSEHFFDAEQGRLVLANEVTKVRIVYVNGLVEERVVRLKRELAEPEQKLVNKTLPRKLADGQSRTFTYGNGVPERAQERWVNVLTSGLGLLGENNEEGQVHLEKIAWSLMLDYSDHEIESVQLVDVTQEPARLVEIQYPGKTKELLFFDVVDIDSPTADWFFTDVVTERIIKVIVTDKNGDVCTLYQPIFIETLAARSPNNVILPEGVRDRREKRLQTSPDNDQPVRVQAIGWHAK
ncbi:MAG: hypothetical protein KDA60_06700 [Planctomycetales bacterium]|nr:hypothetical protein [Planctomycetales bacterium]